MTKAYVSPNDGGNSEGCSAPEVPYLGAPIGGYSGDRELFGGGQSCRSAMVDYASTPRPP